MQKKHSRLPEIKLPDNKKSAYKKTAKFEIVILPFLLCNEKISPIFPQKSTKKTAFRAYLRKNTKKYRKKWRIAM